MKSVTGGLDTKYSHAQVFDKTYNVMDHIDSSRSVEYQAIGSNIYTSNSGARIVKFRLSDDRAWLDPSSVRVQYKIKNTSTVGTENLYPLKSHGFFTRLRAMSRGSLIEDIGEYNRVHEMFQNLKPDNEVKSDTLEGFKNNFALDGTSGASDAGIFTYFTNISKETSMTVSFKPLSGLLNQANYIPLSFLPIELELELSTDPKANIISKDLIADADKVKVSEKWELYDFKILCDQKYYSPNYTDMFVNHITQENSSYKIPINNYTSLYQTLLNTGPIDINISKSVHSLDRVYVSFFRDLSTSNKGDPIVKNVYLKEYNCFYSPASNALLRYDPAFDINRLSLKIGSLNFPDMPLNSQSVCYYYLNKCHPETNISVLEYNNTKFISLFNLERADADSNVLARGIDTNNKNLSLMVDLAKGVTGKPQPPEYVHVVMVNELMINIFNTHVDILE
jgi:hypothetical protein